MAIVERSNNRILPNNVRAADVARKAIDEITPVQQQKMMAAFYVQGFEAIHYSHLLNGRKCSCQSSRKVLNSILGKDGKADQGVINELLTGNARFGISDYGSNALVGGETLEEFTITSPDNPGNKHRGVFDNVTKGGVYNQERVEDGEAFGDNGPLQEFDIDQLVGDFDVSTLGFSDVACPVCFGTGYVGGYSPYNGQRIVITPDMVSFVDNLNVEILYNEKPFRATGGFECIITLPRGARAIDSFNLWNMNKRIPCLVKVDGSKVDYTTLLHKCDGKPHKFEVQCGEWSHLELQFNVTDKSAYFEFPTMTQGSDISLLDQTEPFQILLSPNVPTVRSMDIITDSVYGKTMIVQSVSWRNTKTRQMLGWECQVRVVQGQELYNLLPKRGRVVTKNKTTNMVIDNSVGGRRT